MTRRRALALLLVAPTVADAQVATIPAVGTHIRVESSAIIGRRATGTLAAMNQGLVTLGIGKRGTKLVVPWSRISDVSVVTGRDERAGAAIGALFGGGAALVTYPYADNRAEFGPLQTEKANAGRIALALALPVAGALVGLRLGPQEWEPLTWRPVIDTVLLEGEDLKLNFAPQSQLQVRHNKRWVKGRLVSDDGDSVAVRTLRATRTMAWSDIAQVSMQESRSRTRGAALGATMGGVYGIARALSGPDRSVQEKQRIIGISVLAGGAVGALIGRANWMRVPLPAR